MPKRTPRGLFMWAPLCHPLCLCLCGPLRSGASPLGPPVPRQLGFSPPNWVGGTTQGLKEWELSRNGLPLKL